MRDFSQGEILILRHLDLRAEEGTPFRVHVMAIVAGLLRPLLVDEFPVSAVVRVMAGIALPSKFDDVLIVVKEIERALRHITHLLNPPPVMALTADYRTVLFPLVHPFRMAGDTQPMIGFSHRLSIRRHEGEGMLKGEIPLRVGVVACPASLRLQFAFMKAMVEDDGGTLERPEDVRVPDNEGILAPFHRIVPHR